jgi:hypothetical protein
MTAKRHGKHSPGYVCPKRATRRLISAYIEPELFEAMREATARAGMTRQDAIEKLCEDFVREQGVKMRGKHREPSPSG